MVGVVLLERDGVRRSLALIQGRLRVSCARLLVAGLVYLGYGPVMGLVSSLLTPSAGSVTLGVVLAAAVQAALVIPPAVVAVSLVGYAELRAHEDRATSTRSLAAASTV